MKPGHTITVLFESGALKVSEFACACHGPHNRGEEAAPGHEIVLPQKGYFEKQSARGRAQGDPTKALYFNKGEPYEIGHPLGGGDVCTIFEIAPETLADFCQDPGDKDNVLEGRPFPKGWEGLSHELALGHFRLLQKVKGGAGALALEEEGLSLLSRIFAGGKPARAAADKRGAEGQRRLAERTVRYLNRHFTDPLTLTKLAREVYSSPYHLCRIFRRETGMTIHGYLSALRLRAALAALKAKDQALTPLALDLGYSSHSHFSAAFQKAFGASPKTVRDFLS